MNHVRVKRFLDSEQVQIYEKQGRRETKDDNLEHSYIYDVQNMPKKHLKDNPFNDDHLQRCTKGT